MGASNPFIQRAPRFCEVCGFFVGNLTLGEWDRTSHLCQECEEYYGKRDPVPMNPVMEPWKTQPQAK